MFTRLASTPCFSRLCQQEQRAAPGIYLAKGNNHSKEKDADANPPRITSNVKQSLQILKQLKEFERQRSGISKPSTRYRKKKEKKEFASDDELYEVPAKLYHTNKNVEVGVPVLLVDGYNVCGYWSKLKKHFSKGRLAIARQKLVEELIWFSDITGIKVVVVYDAMKSGLPTRKETFANVDIVYSGNKCADAWIEREVDALRKDGCPEVTVVTSDFLQQQVANGSGAFVWSCKELISEINDARKEYEEFLLEERSFDMQPGLLESSLPPDALRSLKELKRKLEESERKC